jgi:hypothetical protein
LGINENGFFRNGERLENQIGKKFDINDNQVDTEVFNNQNKYYKKNLNSDIVKKIFRNDPVVKKNKVIISRRNRWKKHHSKFRVDFIRHLTVNSENLEELDQVLKKDHIDGVIIDQFQIDKEQLERKEDIQEEQLTPII